MSVRNSVIRRQSGAQRIAVKVIFENREVLGKPSIQPVHVTVDAPNFDSREPVRGKGDGHLNDQEGSVLYQGDGLSRAQRLKNARTFRQKQLREYYEFEKQEEQGRGSPKRFSPSQNRKGTNVMFHHSLLLQDAVQRSDVTEVVSLLDQGADPNTSSVSGVTVLHQCCMEDNLRIAQILISRGADVNAQDDDCWTPLHTACACECTEIVQLLLDNGADVKVLDVDGCLAADLSPKDSETRTVIKQYMYDTGFDDASVKGIKDSESLRMLAEVNDFLQNGGYVNSHNDEQVTLLHMAAANNYIQVARLLAQKEADVDAQDDDGMTPLHLASKFGHAGMVQLLLTLNANPEEKDFSGLTAADVAASDIIEEMIKTACQTYDPSKRTSVVLQEVFPGGTEDVQQETMYRKINKMPLAKTEAYYEAETRLPPDGKEDNLEVIEECKQDIEVLFPVQSEETYLPSRNAMDNLSSLAELTENSILQELMLRYSRDIVYTYVGDILITVNPFKMLPMYTCQASEMYSNLSDRSQLTPHIFAIADRAYQSFLWEKKSQCCIISGESGAGKTETAKYFVQHLLTRASSSESEMNDKIQQVSPLLEVFGNAQTIMNDNSSRFGKFVELLLQENGSVAGARITEYLLEKSRVTHQGEGERNFHIFYLLFNGLDKRQKELLGLKHPQDHRYLKKGDLTKLNSAEVCGNRFKAVQNCLQYIGFSREDEEYLWSIMAAIILLGDMKFVANPDMEGAVMIRKEEQPLQDKVSELLQVNADELITCITSDTIITRGEEFRKYRNKFQAEDCRDALAKALYSRLFSWVVNNINQLLRPMDELSDLKEIGVLDIFGFENFHMNSFEQICINLANENLQGFFNEHIFQREKADCELEGIDTSEFTFTSNDQIIKVFQEKNRGIIDLLNEESHFPRGTDQSLANKLHQGPGTWGKSVYFAPNNGGTSFSIMHYAGKVTYTLDGVVEKNRDTLAKSLIHCMRCSQNRVVREMFMSKLTRKGSIAPSLRQAELKRKPSIEYGTNQPGDVPFRRFKNMSGRRSRKRIRPSPATNKRGAATVAYHFKNSLAELMEKMNQSNPHFVRCIKPNTSKLSDKFTPEYVIAQLRYTGIMETTKIRRDGYPLRLTAHQFMERFGAMVMLAPSKIYTNSPQKCQEALTYYGIRNFKFGKTKLFFKHYHTEKLQLINYELMSKVIICQKVIKGHLTRKKMKVKLEVMQQETEDISVFLDFMEGWMEFIYEAQKDKSEHDENRHMEETLRSVAEDEENKLSANVDGLPADSTFQSDIYENQEAYLPAGDELSMKESTISSLSNLSSNLNDLDLPDSSSEGTIQAQSGSNPEASTDTYVCMQDLNTAAKQSAPATVQVLEPQSEDLEPPPPPPPVEPGTDAEDFKQEYVSMNFPYAATMEDDDTLPPPPVMDEVFVNEEEEFPPAPPAPPMSDVSEERKKNIANIREQFLKQEQEAILKAQEKPKLERPKIRNAVQPFVVQSDNVPSENPHNGVHSPKRIPSSGGHSPYLGNGNKIYTNEDTISQSSVNGINKARVPSKKRPPAPKRDETTRLSVLSQTSSGSTEYERYDDVIGVAIPPPPPYPAPVPPSHYTNVQTMSLHQNIPPPPPMQPPPPPMPYHHGDDIYEDELNPPPFPQQDGGLYDFIDHTCPPPPPPNHPSTLRSSYPPSSAPIPPPAPPAPPAPPTSSLAQQLGGVRLKQNQGNQRKSAPPKVENKMDQMLQEIKRKQIERRDSAQNSTCYEVDDASMQQATKSPPPTSPKPAGKSAGSPPPATKPKPNAGNFFKGPSQPKSVSKPLMEKEEGGGTPPPPTDDGIPAWKRNMLEKKRKEEEAKQREEEMKKQAEEEKWKGIPEWKRKIMEAKEQKKAEELAQKMEADKDKLELEAKLAEMPEWKRKVYIKKHGLDKNGDENANSDSPSSVS